MYHHMNIYIYISQRGAAAQRCFALLVCGVSYPFPYLSPRPNCHHPDCLRFRTKVMNSYPMMLQIGFPITGDI